MPKNKRRPTQTIALTGATGFVGRILIQHLLDEGFQVKALTRRPQSDIHTNLSWVVGDLDNFSALTKLVADVDAIIHMAGLVKALSYKDFLAVNAQGTQHILDAMTANTEDQPYFMHISSLAAREQALSYYAASKKAGENIVQSRLKDGYCIMRPPAVFGPGDTEFIKILRPMAQWGLAVQAGFEENRLSLIHVNDLVSAIIAAVKTQPLAGLYEIDDGMAHGYSMADIGQMVAQCCQRPVGIIKLPKSLIKGLGWLSTLWGLIIRTPQIFTHKKANEANHPNWVVDRSAHDSFCQQTGWQPHVDTAKALGEVIAADR